MKLIGTSHWDLEGTERLQSLLDHLQPTSLSLEVPDTKSPSMVRENILWYRQHFQDLADRVKMPRILRGFVADAIANFRFEAVVGIEYTAEQGIPLYFVDHPGVQFLGEVGDAAFVQQVQRCSQVLISLGAADRPYNPDLRREYVRDSDRVYFDPAALEEVSSNFIFSATPVVTEAFARTHQGLTAIAEEREVWMAQCLRELQPDVHVGGLAHVFEGYKEYTTKVMPLYERIKNLVEERLRLCPDPHSGSH